MQDLKDKGFTRATIILLCIAIVFAVFVGRLAQWQLIQGNNFRAESELESSNYTILKATRGEILDINGNSLVSNTLSYDIVFDYSKLKRSERNDNIYRLILLMEKCGAKWVDRLPVTTDENGEYVFKEDMESEIDYMKSSSMLALNDYATAKDCVETMISDDFYDIVDFPKEYVLKIASVRYNMHRSSFSIRYPYTFAKDLSPEALTIISENLSDFPGVSIEISTKRTYNDGALAPHILGYEGALSAEEYQSLLESGQTYSSKNYSGYSYNDTIGKTGIEAVMENELRGTNGKETVIMDANGNYSSEKIIAPTPGNSVFLTLDANLQAVVNRSLEENVKGAQENGKTLYAEAVAQGRTDEHFGEDCTAGAVVVLDVETFGVRAMSTYPTYDLEKSLSDVAYYNLILNDEKNTPLVNRATMGTYTPGSIFKPAVALAALQEGVITSSTQITCNHVYHNSSFTGFNPMCLGTHGSITLGRALERSCNIFFYETGYRLGINSMNFYCSALGLGVRTGLEIGERSGILAGPEEYSEYHNGEEWTDGLTVISAIGQSDNSFTPLQLATYCATIANNGVRLNTHLIDKVTDYSKENVISKTAVTQAADLNIDQKFIDEVKKGMALVCDEGGTAARFAYYDIDIAAKTGTATTIEGVHSDNATFIAFAPYEKPEIAVAIVLEYGSSNTYVQNIAEDIFDAYFHGKTVSDLFPEEVETDIPENTETPESSEVA